MEGKIRTIKSYGRTVAKALSENQRKDLEEYVSNSDFDFFKSKYNSFILEIGFGNGENILKLSKDCPESGIIGVEPFKNSCIKLIRDIKETAIENIFVFNDDVKNLDSLIPFKMLAKTYILFPDPWPKKKHNKRRLLNEEFLKWLISKTSDEIIFVTDNKDYFDSVIEFAKKYSDVCIADDKELIANTKYRQKAIAEGRKPRCAIFKNFSLVH